MVRKGRRTVLGMKRFALPVSAAVLLFAGCSSSQSGSADTTVAATATTAANMTTETATDAAQPTKFKAEVWADNWFSLYVNGVKVGEDSVPITTERSFNSETISFTATYPFTIAMVTKDYKQNDTGLEYIGTDRQQVGDGGFIAQITEVSTGKVVATTNTDWRGLVVHQAPLNLSCEKSTSPDSDCTSRITAEPAQWTSSTFDDSQWVTATTYSEEAVGVKDGYNDISWSPNAQLIWTSNLKMDNTILWRFTVK